MKVKQKPQTKQLKNNFGRQFGGYGFLISSSISFEERVIMLCQLWATCFGQSHHPTSVNSTTSTRKTRCMPFGCAVKWRQLGARLIASTKQISPTLRALATYYLFFCRLRMIVERKFSLLQLGSCGTGEMPFTLADLCDLRPKSYQQQETCCKTSWLSSR